MTPVLGVLRANLFVRLLHSKDATSAELVYALPVRARSFFRFFARQKVLIATNVAHEQDGLKPQNLILWRSLNAALVFDMKNDPRFGGP